MDKFFGTHAYLLQLFKHGSDNSTELNSCLSREKYIWISHELVLNLIRLI